MRILSSAVDAHQFAQVRRRGYDPDEVDVVMARLAETIREYEAETAELKEKLRAGELSSEAIQRTFVAAQHARDDMIVEAEAAAAETIAAAQREADEIRAGADEVLEAAQARAEALRIQADEVATSAIADAEVTREEADRILENSRAAAERVAAEVTSSAKATSEQILDTARKRAEDVMRKSEEEKGDLERRLRQLRTAVIDIENQLRELSTTALERAGFIRSMIDLEYHTDAGDSFAPAAGSTTEQEPQRETTAPPDSGPVASTRPESRPPAGKAPKIGPPPARATANEGPAPRAQTARKARQPGPVLSSATASPPLTMPATPTIPQMAARRATAFAEPDGSGRLPAARTLIDPAPVQVATPRPEVKTDPVATGRNGDDDPRSTIYQRRVGGLRSRIAKAAEQAKAAHDETQAEDDLDDLR